MPLAVRKLKKYTPTKFMADTSHYDKNLADYAVLFIEQLCHTKGTWAGKPFELIDWQEQIIRDMFGVIKDKGYRQFNTAYIEIPKKQGKSELAAAVALLLTCGDGEERAEVYGCAADRNQAKIVFDVAVDMVRFCPALSKQVLHPALLLGAGRNARPASKARPCTLRYLGAARISRNHRGQRHPLRIHREIHRKPR